VGANIWRSVKSVVTHKAWAERSGSCRGEVCDADLVKIRVCSLRSGNTSKKKSSRHLFHLNVVVKTICLNIMFQNIIFLLKFDFTAMY
jgi:hypothetical protein